MLAVTPDLLQARDGIQIRVAEIFDGDRLRPVDPDWVIALASQFDIEGQEQPIVVRTAAPGENLTQPYALVIGAHRLAAAKSLGWEAIRAEIRDYSPLRARLAEIDENLFRHELNALDRAVFLLERRRVWDDLNPDSRHGGDRKTKGASKSQGLRLDPKRFTKEAADRCNLSERTVQAALSLASALTPAAVAMLRGTDWSRNASELQRLAAEPAERQLVLARIHARDGVSSVVKARLAAGDAPTGEGDPQEELFRRIVSNWERLDTKGRRRFLEHAGLSDTKAARGRASAAAGIDNDPRQVDLEDAIAASKTERRA